MKRQMISVALSIITIFLLMGLWLIVGCDQERSPLSPDQESALAPPAGKGNPHDDDNASAELESDGNTDHKPKPNGKATGNPHVITNENAKAKPKANGKATGNPHFDGDVDAEPNGKAKGVNGDLPGQTKRKGAVKMPLLDVDDLSVGWAKANTTANDDDVDVDNDELVVVGDEAVGVSNGTLIITVHLKDGEPDTEFDIKVIVDDDGDEDTEDDSTAHIFENVLVTNKKGRGNAQVTIALISENGYTSPIYVRVMVDPVLTAEQEPPFDALYDTATEENVLTAVALKK